MKTLKLKMPRKRKTYQQIMSGAYDHRNGAEAPPDKGDYRPPPMPARYVPRADALITPGTRVKP
jgi:hypothetical protein